MTNLLQAAQQMLWAVEKLKLQSDYWVTATNNLRQAIAQAEQNHSGEANEMVEEHQEPVAWLIPGAITGDKKLAEVNGANAIPLYASPVRTKDLTDDEVWEILETLSSDIVKAVRAVIAADREKNRGD